MNGPPNPPQQPGPPPQPQPQPVQPTPERAEVNPDNQPAREGSAEPVATEASNDTRVGGSRDNYRHLVSETGNMTHRNQVAATAQENLSLGVAAGRDVRADHLIGQQTINTYYGRDPGQDIHPGPLPGRIAIAVERAFVGAIEIHALSDAHKDRQSFILRAPSGRGRMAAAVKLMQYRGVSQIYLLASDVDLTQFTNVDDNSGYILCDPVVPPRAGALHAIAPLLVQHKAHLVITMTSQTSLREEDLRDFVVPLTTVPTHSDVLLAHLELYLDSRERAGNICARTEFGSLIDEIAAQDPPMRRIAEFARLIAEVVGDALDPDIVQVREQLARRAAEDFEIWFDNLDTEERANAIALAVLNGLPYEYVTEATHTLHRLFARPTAIPVGGGGGQAYLYAQPIPEHFAEPRRGRLQKLQAMVESKRIPGDYGETETEIVRYVSSVFPRQVIKRAWSEFMIQPLLIEWLGRLVEHPAEPVRIQAATMLGFISLDSYDYVSHTVFERWAHSKNRLLREAVAHALHVPADEARLRPSVTRMVHGWIGVDEDDDPLARASAVRAYGYSLGRAEPDASLRVLRKMALVDDIRVAVAIGETMAQLLIDNEERVHAILLTLQQWLDDYDREATAHLAFAIVAAGLDAIVPVTDNEARSTWPALLWLAARDPLVGGGLAEVWYHILRQSSYFPRQAEDLLFTWAQMVETSPLGCETLATLVAGICHGDPAARDYVLVECDTWIESDVLTPTPQARTAIRAKLTNEVYAR